MRERITQAIKDAMKAGEKERVATLRLVAAAIKDRDLGVTAGGAITDADLPALLQKMIKQRRESIDIYAKAGRDDLAQKERAEIAILEEFLPKQMTEAEAEGAVTAVVQELGASSAKDMGAVMAALKQRYAGQMDFGKASALVKARLK